MNLRRVSRSYRDLFPSLSKKGDVRPSSNSVPSVQVSEPVEASDRTEIEDYMVWQFVASRIRTPTGELKLFKDNEETWTDFKKSYKARKSVHYYQERFDEDISPKLADAPLGDHEKLDLFWALGIPINKKFLKKVGEKFQVRHDRNFYVVSYRNMGDVAERWEDEQPAVSPMKHSLGLTPPQSSESRSPPRCSARLPNVVRSLSSKKLHKRTYLSKLRSKSLPSAGISTKLVKKKKKGTESAVPRALNSRAELLKKKAVEKKEDRSEKSLEERMWSFLEEEMRDPVTKEATQLKVIPDTWTGFIVKENIQHKSCLYFHKRFLNKMAPNLHLASFDLQTKMEFYWAFQIAVNERMLKELGAVYDMTMDRKGNVLVFSEKPESQKKPEEEKEGAVKVGKRKYRKRTSLKILDSKTSTDDDYDPPVSTTKKRSRRSSESSSEDENEFGSRKKRIGKRKKDDDEEYSYRKPLKKKNVVYKKKPIVSSSEEDPSEEEDFDPPVREFDSPVRDTGSLAPSVHSEAADTVSLALSVHSDAELTNTDSESEDEEEEKEPGFHRILGPESIKMLGYLHSLSQDDTNDKVKRIKVTKDLWEDYKTRFRRERRSAECYLKHFQTNLRPNLHKMNICIEAKVELYYALGCPVDKGFLEKMESFLNFKLFPNKNILHSYWLKTEEEKANWWPNPRVVWGYLFAESQDGSGRLVVGRIDTNDLKIWEKFNEKYDLDKTAEDLRDHYVNSLVPNLEFFNFPMKTKIAIMHCLQIPITETLLEEARATIYLRVATDGLIKSFHLIKNEEIVETVDEESSEVEPSDIPRKIVSTQSGPPVSIDLSAGPSSSSPPKKRGITAGNFVRTMHSFVDHINARNLSEEMFEYQCSMSEVIEDLGESSKAVSIDHVRNFVRHALDTIE